MLLTPNDYFKLYILASKWFSFLMKFELIFYEWYFFTKVDQLLRSLIDFDKYYGMTFAQIFFGIFVLWIANFYQCTVYTRRRVHEVPFGSNFVNFHVNKLDIENNWTQITFRDYNIIIWLRQNTIFLSISKKILDSQRIESLY